MQEQNIEVIREQDLSFISRTDSLRIFYDVYMPKAFEYPVVVQIAHGMVEHKGRYVWLGTKLAQSGFIVVINDHRGHGKSIDNTHQCGEMKGIADNTDKDLSQYQQLSGFERAVMDMHELTQIAKARFAPQKLILLGHSMGSLLSRAYLKHFSYELNALILSGSPAYNPFVGVGKLLAQLLYKCGLETKGKYFINALSFGGFNRAFEKSSDEGYASGAFAWLCRDKAVVEAYKADKACCFVFSLQSFIGLFGGMMFVNDTQGLNGAHLPLLIISGDDDSCGHFGKGVKKIALQYEKCGFDVQLKLYEGARHEIFNEINKEQVFADVLSFIKSVV